MTLALIGALVKRGGRAILDAADFEAQPGRLCAICGPNGAGKSTALSVLSGAMKADRGEARLDGLPLSSLSAEALARRRAVVAQQHRLSFPFLVHEVVEIGRAPHARLTGPREDRRIVGEAMAAMQIGALSGRNYLTLSGGERQRVMIAKALAQIWEPPEAGARWLLLDEPTAALDLKYQLALMELLVGLARSGWGILAVLHDLPLVAEYADHVILMQRGSVDAEGGPNEVLTPQRVGRVYDLGRPFEVRQAPAASIS